MSTTVVVLIGALLLSACNAGVVPAGAAASRGAGRARPATSEEERPNVLILLTDDQRVGTMRVMAKTRNWLGDHGVKYSRAFVTTPLCCPSRASIMTGLYSHNHGVTTNSDGEDFPSEKSLQAKLRAAGYRTGIVGKYLNGWETEDDPPHFDKWAITKNGTTAQDTTYNVNGKVRTITRYQTSVFRDKAVKFLESWDATADAAPWLLYVSFTAPHSPYVAAKKYRKAPVPKWTDKPPREVDRSDKPPYILERDEAPKDAKMLRKRQLRMLMSVDDAVGKIRRTLGELRERGDTLVVFTSDNGFTWGEHGVVEEKRVPYTPSVRVPLYLRWPGVAGAGVVEAALAANVDVPVTALDAAGLPTADLDGRNLLSLSRERVFLEFPSPVTADRWTVPEWASIWTPEWQYTVYFEGGLIAFREYYDLVADAHQLHNIAGELDTAALDAEILALRSCTGATCP